MLSLRDLEHLTIKIQGSFNQKLGMMSDVHIKYGFANLTINISSRVPGRLRKADLLNFNTPLLFIYAVWLISIYSYVAGAHHELHHTQSSKKMSLLNRL